MVGEWKSGLIGNRSTAPTSLCSYSLLLLCNRDIEDGEYDGDKHHSLYALIMIVICTPPDFQLEGIFNHEMKNLLCYIFENIDN